jgi:hypothetical protein
MSELSVGQLKGLPVNNNVVTVPAGEILYAPGHVVQVVSTTKTDTFTASVGNVSTVAVTGLTATITPKFSTSKILVTVNIHASSSGDAISLILKRNTTSIGLGDAAGNRARRTAVINPADNLAAYRLASANFSILDSPESTSSLVYSVEIGPILAGVSRNVFVNRTNNDDDLSSVPRVSSIITLQEIAA